MQYRGKGLRGKAPLFGVSLISWLVKFAVSSHLHKSRAFNHGTPAMWKIKFDAVRGQYNKFVKRSYLYLNSEYAMSQRTTKYGIFAIALLFHIINNSSLFNPIWLQRNITKQKKTRKAYIAGYIALDKRGKLANKIKRVLYTKAKKATRIKYTSKVQSNRVKLYQFPTPLNLYATMDYMRNSGIRFNKRIHANTKYNTAGNFAPNIYLPKVRSLLVQLRRQRKLKRSAARALLVTKRLITSQPKVTQGLTYSLPTLLNTKTVKINHTTNLVEYNFSNNR